MKMEEKRQKKTNQFFKGKIPYFFPFTFYD